MLPRQDSPAVGLDLVRPIRSARWLVDERAEPGGAESLECGNGTRLPAHTVARNIGTVF